MTAADWRKRIPDYIGLSIRESELLRDFEAKALAFAGRAEAAEAEAAWLRERVKELLAQWRKEITGAPKNNDYLCGYWDGRATAHGDLVVLERGGGGAEPQAGGKEGV